MAKKLTERQAFEAWLRLTLDLDENPLQRDRLNPSEYADDMWYLAFKAWQASARRKRK